MADWVDDVIADWGKGPGVVEIPDQCEQSACVRSIATWCPLCTRFYCLDHDPLFPIRRHDCVGGVAEEVEE